MPNNKNTRKKYATGSSLLESGYDAVIAADNPVTMYNKPLQKLDKAVDNYPVLDSFIAPLAKGVGALSDAADTLLNAPRVATEKAIESVEEGGGIFGGIGKKGRQERRTKRQESRQDRRAKRKAKRATRRAERRGARDLETYEEKLAREARDAQRGAEQTQRIRNESRARGDAMFQREVEALAGSNAGTEGSRGTRRVVSAEGGPMDKQMSMLMEEPVDETMLPDEEMPMIPDEQMEEDYVDYVMEETLSNEDRNYLISALEKDDRLSEIFDQVVESATEFSGSGPIEGPGNEKSDSIPARLSDGEFVFTAKATEEIGEDTLMSMMKDAEASADQRQGVAYGGMIDEEDQAVPIPTTASRAAQGNVPNVVKQSRQVEEEMLKSSPRRYYVPVSG